MNEPSNSKTIEPIGKRLILKPSDSKMRGTIFVPDNISHNMSTACKVVARGKDVYPSIKIGSTVLCRVGTDRSNTIDNTKSFWTKEDCIYAILINNIIFPFGRTVLIKRDVQTIQEGSIVIPELHRTQSLEGWVVRTGLYHGHTRINGIDQKARVRLRRWEAHMIQIALEDGSEGMIVNDTDIEFKYEQ